MSTARERGLTVTIDDAAQSATIYEEHTQRVVGSLHRRKAGSDGPQWNVRTPDDHMIYCGPYRNEGLLALAAWEESDSV